ncbi:hypothetical protein J7L68_00305 [bacterium]|nr:hypothetical protein [bacterium]
MLFSIFIAILIILIVIIVILFVMPINIRWSRERYKKSIWRIDCPFAKIGSDDKKILWFTIGQGKDRKANVKSQHIEPNGAIDNNKSIDDDNKPEKADEKSIGKKTNKFDISRLKKFVAQKKTFLKTINALYIFLKRLMLSFKFDNSNSLSIRLSFEEPYYLGIICGVIYPIIYSVPNLGWINFIPDFDTFDDDAEIFGEIRFDTKFFRIVWSSIILIWKLPKIKLYRLWRENRRENKNQIKR